MCNDYLLFPNFVQNACCNPCCDDSVAAQRVDSVYSENNYNFCCIPVIPCCNCNCGNVGGIGNNCGCNCGSVGGANSNCGYNCGSVGGVNDNDCHRPCDYDCGNVGGEADNDCGCGNVGGSSDNNCGCGCHRRRRRYW